MNDLKKISSALISVYHKDNLEKIIQKLNSLNVKLYSTGGTKDFIEGMGIKVTAVEDVTSYPSIFGGRVKTLHPKIFGGILFRRGEHGPWTSLSSSSAKGAEKMRWPANWALGNSQSGAGDRPFVGKNLRIAWISE